MSFSDDQQGGVDYTRSERSLRYARVGGVEYGSRLFPSAGEAAPTAGALALTVGPNPTAGPTTVRYARGTSGPVRLAVADVLGREVAVLAEGDRGAGPHEAAFDAGRLAPGRLAPCLYLARLVAGGQTVTRRLTVAR